MSTNLYFRVVLKGKMDMPSKEMYKMLNIFKNKEFIHLDRDENGNIMTLSRKIKHLYNNTSH